MMSTLPPWRLTLRTWIALLALGLALWAIISYAELILEILGVFFGALLFSLAIRPFADALARRHIPRGITVFGVYLGMAGVLILLSGLLVPIISAEVTLLQTQGPNLIQQALSHIAAVPLLKQLLPSTTAVGQQLDSLLSPLVNAVTGLGGFALDLLIVLILAYFFATDVGLSESLLQRWLPQSYQPRARLAVVGLRNRLTRWVWARVAVALYFGLTFGLGLTLLRIPFALTIGLVGGVLEIIPYFGSTVGLILALLSALTGQPLEALWVAIYFVIIVEVKSHIIEPAFYGRAIGLHPAAVLVALLAGLKAAGIVGVLFAVPVAVVSITFLEEIQAATTAPPDHPNTDPPG